ncbi:Flagellar protein (FlbD) [Rosistilla oblonga]|uniref:Flagellar protein (FlbD) n=1 Tax=Rosistilla oblonga TaxID=2527990 RepID=A0A518IU09_9BACT|nr:flagellar FlbD family protein [Rosistilla oblonga]QDV15255.1 Flagellar protein (FlbD) [Rosistilla oblonga]QDV56579.1 Flagellar protein (FlbD) [Rosistilla oblonga]
MLYLGIIDQVTPHGDANNASTHRSAKLSMIKLTRIDGEAFILNAELIRYVENRPDTFVTLTTGERFIVRESMDEVVDRAIGYQQQKQLLPTMSPHCGA